ncbi:MAG: CPBP family intramembrane metalloprotease [Treponema sp.]|nr:CPBP family intramembrane metalloprotease [Treponema sp.]
MSIYIEALVIYGLLFFRGAVFTEDYPSVLAFSTSRELIRLFTYTIPGLALIWYFLCKRQTEEADIPKPGFADLRAFMVCLPGLILAGFGVSSLAFLGEHIFGGSIGLPQSPLVKAPESLSAWLVLGASCLGTGYLEESYFRLYLLRRLKQAGLTQGKSIFFATLLFSWCHLYEGPWGVLNAVLAGLGLSLVLVKQRTFHGIAWSHGGYNAFVYALALF